MTILLDLPMEDYLAHPGVGSSALKNILLTPADFKAGKERKSRDTKATNLGTMVHSFILEPEKFRQEYALQPEDWGPLNENPGRGRWDAFKKANPGKNYVSFKEAEYLTYLDKSAQAHQVLQQWLKRGKPEVTAYGYYKGMSIKARSDLLCQEDGMMWDIKTTSESVDDDRLFWTVFNSGYHFQAAHHMHVFNSAFGEEVIKDFGWIFISTTNPSPHIRMVKAPEILLQWGKRDHEAALEMLKKCLELKEWKGYPDTVNILEVPESAMKKYE